MAEWSRNKVNSNNLNSGQEYTKDSQLSINALNSIVNGGLYTQDFVEHLTDTPDLSDAGNVGTPSVEFVYNPAMVTTLKPYVRFKFSNLKGEQGIQGERGIQGEKGDKGDKGEKGDKGDVGAIFSYDEQTRILTITTE